MGRFARIDSRFEKKKNLLLTFQKNGIAARIGRESREFQCESERRHYSRESGQVHQKLRIVCPLSAEIPHLGSVPSAQPSGGQNTPTKIGQYFEFSEFTSLGCCSLEWPDPSGPLNRWPKRHRARPGQSLILNKSKLWQASPRTIGIGRWQSCS